MQSVTEVRVKTGLSSKLYCGNSTRNKANFDKTEKPAYGQESLRENGAEDSKLLEKTKTLKLDPHNPNKTLTVWESRGPSITSGQGISTSQAFGDGFSKVAEKHKKFISRDHIDTLLAN